MTLCLHMKLCCSDAWLQKWAWGKFSASFFKWLWAWILSGLADLWAFKFLKNLTTLLMRCCWCYWGKYWSKMSIETFGFIQTIIVNMAIELPVKALLQDLTRKGPFFLHPCKILKDLAKSCGILQELWARFLQNPARSCRILDARKKDHSL